MTLFEIDENLRELLENGFNNECVNAETGEIDFDLAEHLIDQYQADKNKKIENIALYILELKSQDKEFDDYIKSVKVRQEQNKKKIESLQNYLSSYLTANEINGFSSVKVKVSFRKSTKCEITDIDKIPSEFKQIVTEEKVDKKQLTQAIKNGEEITGAELVESRNLQIK